MNKEEEFIYNNTQHYERAQFVREIAKLQEENKQLKERIDKAIKYIEDERKLNNEFDMIDIMNYEDFDVVYAEDILQILKGEENE